MPALFNNVCRAAVLGALGGSGYKVIKNIYEEKYKGSQTLSLIADLVICRFVARTPFYQAAFLGGKSWWIHTSRGDRDPLKEHADMVLVGAVVGVIGQVALNIIYSIRF